MSKQPKEIIIVSGLPRTGTSMLMQILKAGGLPLVTDGVRHPDVGNPNGYYEFERVKHLGAEGGRWLNEARGQAIKIIASLLLYMPDDYQYKVLFMNRKMDEILRSQRKMMTYQGKLDNIGDGEWAQLLHKHVKEVKIWLNQRPNIETLELDYNAIMANPEPYLGRINDFLNNTLNERAMRSAIDPNLYRNRL